MPKIAFFELEPWEAEYLKGKLRGFQVDCFNHSLSVKDLPALKAADAIGVFIYSPVTAKLIEKLPKLKLVATLSTGFDHVDLKACKKRGIKVCNVPEYGSRTVAEHTFALLLSLSRKIPQSAERTKRGGFGLEGLRGVDLAGKTIGIIGLGRIGKNVAEIAKAFGMRVLGVDPFVKRVSGVEIVSLKQLLKECDVITLHTPLNEKTRHLLNSKTLKEVKKGAVLINTARGGLVDTPALLEALKEKRISAAGLDVLEEECVIREEKELLQEAFKKKCDFKVALAQHALIAQDNVLVTPHNAFNSQEALERILDTTIENVKSFFTAKPINVVA